MTRCAVALSGTSTVKPEAKGESSDRARRGLKVTPNLCALLTNSADAAEVYIWRRNIRAASGCTCNMTCIAVYSLTRSPEQRVIGPKALCAIHYRSKEDLCKDSLRDGKGATKLNLTSSLSIMSAGK